MRGLPGSGKSTLAKTLGGVICSADNFFMVGGEYQFKSELLGLAHSYCIASVEDAMRGNEETVVVDNTNIRRAHMLPYLELAEEYGYEVKYKETEEKDVEVCFMRGVHNVPYDTIQKMSNMWESTVEPNNYLDVCKDGAV